MTGHMAPLRKSSDGEKKGVRRSGDDAFKLTLDYLKQEALEPLKGLGRFLLFGLVGSLLIAIGVLLALVGILRLLQDETGTALTGDWSWVPYFAVSLIGVAVAGLAGWRITAGPGRAKLPRTSENASKEGSN
jgi:predicted cobalt transporter CbtA